MATETLIARLIAPNLPAGAPATSFTPLKIDISQAPEGAPVEVHETRPASPTTWLQIWRIGTGEWKTWKGPGVLMPRGPDPQLQPELADRFCAEIAGYVEKKGATYTFIATEAFAPSVAPTQNGWALLTVPPATTPAFFPLVDRGVNPVVALGAVLRQSKAVEDTEVLKSVPTLSLTNLAGVICSQLAEGGLVVGFYVVNPKPKDEDTRSKDAAFATFGRHVSHMVHGLTIENGFLNVGSAQFTDPGGWKDVVRGIEAVRKAVGALLGLEAKDYPKVNRLFTLTHGVSEYKGNRRPSMMFGSDPYWVNTTSVELPLFMDGLKEHLSTDAVWAQLSCELGAEPGKGSQHGGFGRFTDFSKGNGATHPSPELMGRGSFADVCRKMLVDRGLPDVSIWAHTSTGHALNNQQLRAFSKNGNMDLCWLMNGLPVRLNTILDTTAWGNKFANSWMVGPDRASDEDDQPLCWKLVDISLKNPAELIQKRRDEWATKVRGTLLRKVAEAFPHPPELGSCIPASPTLNYPEGGRSLLAKLPDIVGQAKVEARQARDRGIAKLLLEGRMPDFCRTWVEIMLKTDDLEGSAWVLADCLAIGTNEDYIRVNLSAYTSEQIAQAWNCYLPTGLLCQAIIHQAKRIICHNMDCAKKDVYDGMYQASNLAMRWHEDILQGRVACGSNGLTEEQSKQVARKFNPNIVGVNHQGRCTIRKDDTSFEHPGLLVAGHKKEIMIAPNHDELPWAAQGENPPPNHQLYFHGFLNDDKPWAEKASDPLAYTDITYTANNTKTGAQGHMTEDRTQAVHGAGFTDYAQGTRLVYPWVRVGQEWMLYPDVLMDPRYFRLLCGTQQAGPFKNRVRYPIPEAGERWQMGR